MILECATCAHYTGSWCQKKLKDKRPSESCPDHKEGDNPFRKDILFRVHEELDKLHLHDHAAKMLTFLTCCTAYLWPEGYRKSIAIKGSSSVGKDNLIKSVLSLFPTEHWIFLTNATQASLEDDISKFRIVAYSEMNLQKEDKGANVHLLETIKQMTEGGTSSLKKDVATGYKLTKHIKQQQKTVLYGTTESSDDEELKTRFIVAGLDADSNKVLAVNQNTLNEFAGISVPKNTSWFVEEIRKKHSYNVILPYLKFIDSSIFDATDPRSMRDTKRLLSMAAAIAWLYQNQRQIKKKVIQSEPFDLLAAIIIAGPFLDRTYAGIGDLRLQKYIDAMNEYCDTKDTEIFPRNEIQKSLGCSINTVKNLSKGCQEVSIIEYEGRENQKIMYRRCQKGVKRVLMGVSWMELFDRFKAQGGIKNPENIHTKLNNLNKILNLDNKYSTLENFDTPHFDTLVGIIPEFNIFLNCSHADCKNSPCAEHPNDHKLYCKKHWPEGNMQTQQS